MFIFQPSLHRTKSLETSTGSHRDAYSIEPPNIIQRRCKHLLQMRSFIQHDRAFYYTDETCNTKIRVWKDTTAAHSSHVRRPVLTTEIKQPGGKDEPILIAHCGNEKGFADDDEVAVCASERRRAAPMDERVPSVRIASLSWTMLRVT